MIYALAAYSITLGVLALYLVTIQHRVRLHAGEIAVVTRGPAPDARRGFNVGACLLAPLWMMRHGLLWPGVLLLAPCIAIGPLAAREMWLPLVLVAAIPFAAGAALGFVGNRIAVSHLGVPEIGTFSATQLRWAQAGIVLHVFVLPWVVYFRFLAT